MEAFFAGHNLDSTRVFVWKIFQCWTLNDCYVKADISDREIALFLDQLTDLVAAAQILHQANRAFDGQTEGGDHVS